jgi:hypothetical protein
MPTNFCRLCVALLMFAPAVVHAQFTLYGVGDLPGGITQSEVRDTTRVGPVLYAVGGSAANPGSTGNDTAFLWTSTGGITALPPLAPGLVDVNPVLASAITPNAAYIATRARFNPANSAQRHAARVTTSGLTQVDLGALPGFSPFSAAIAISSDGSVLYGFARYTGAGLTQAVRYTVAGPTITAIPFLNAGDDTSIPAARGTSSDGSVMVGYSGTSTGSALSAFRYVEGSGISAIPYLPGGTWNNAQAVSPDGNLVMGVSESATAPNGEIYLYNASTAALTALGTPAAGWSFNGLGGMTPDGSVVALSLGDPANPANAGFIHNANGWHEVQAIVAGTGIDVTGWTIDIIYAVSSDGTRIWGSGDHNGNREGVIVEFPAGYLAAYGASPPAQSIVGAYSVNDLPAEGANFIAFLANGTYFQVQDALASDAPTGVDGVERGTYTWDAVTKAFTLTTILDTNGDEGASGISGVAGITANKLDNIFTAVFPGGGASSLPMVTGSSPIVGAWVFGDSTVADSSSIVAFFANGTYLFGFDGPGNVGQPDGMERGTYTWNAGTGAFAATTIVDTNGTAGLSNPVGSVTLTISGDTLTYTDSGGPVTAYRVVAAPLTPSMVVGMSHKVHGSGGPFDLVTGTVLTNPTTDPRIGPNQNMVFTFDKPVIAGVATVTEGVAVAGTPTFNANTMTVPLTGVTDQQYVTVTLSNVTSADGGTGGSGVMRVGYLMGDVNQSRVVSVGDLGLVNAQLAQPVSKTNFLKDVNASGTLTLADKGLTNTNLTRALPPP